MANAITPLRLTTANSSVCGNPTMVTVGSATNSYIDCRNIDASRMILVVTKLASGANSATNEVLTIKDGDSKAGYSAYALGDLKIEVSSVPHSTKPTGVELNCTFIGPFETARFKDSDGYIKINTTRGQNLGAIGAILI